MSRSSIFNFESFEGFAPRVPWTLLAVVAVIAAVELAARLTPNDALMPPNSSWGQVRFVETAVIAPASAPRIVVLGSSRMRDAVAPRVLEKALGLPEGAVVNAALGGGRLFDALLVYERNRAVLKQAKVLIVGLDDWHFSLGAHPLGTLYELEAPMADRLALPEPPRNLYALDGVFQLRVKMPIAGARLARALSGRPERALWTLDAHGRLRNSEDRLEPERDRAADARQLAALHYLNFRQSKLLTGHLERLVALAKADGLEVILIDPPNSSWYRRVVGENYEQACQAYKGLAQETAVKLGVPSYRYEAPEDCGLTDADFRDYGHLTPAGAERFTGFLAGKWKDSGYDK
ncbi:MAG: SGNH/GDSL hydrolase family protein [Planctomycetota bacterium]|nr:SGNH/GDSL hydrolase family protein [Planctomycetota bacterium]